MKKFFLLLLCSLLRIAYSQLDMDTVQMEKQHRFHLYQD